MRQSPLALAMVALGVILFACQNPALAIPAFPGAEGGGANTIGGRGGTVIEVTSLAAAGPGTLRDALLATGPRTVVFRVGGTIDLGGSTINVTNDNVTIAGQTAPGDGIQLKNGQISVNANEFIMRYMRLRPGPAHSNVDGLSLGGVSQANRRQNAIIDHVSSFWGVDETMAVGSEFSNLTVQHSIIAEGLNNSLHDEGPHSRGLMVTSRAENVTLHHNLIYNSYKRNPLIQSSDADVVNNVMVNKTSRQGMVKPFKKEVRANWIGNYFRNQDGIRAPIRVWDFNTGYDGDSELYYEGNYDSHFRSFSTPAEEALLAENLIEHSSRNTDTGGDGTIQEVFTPHSSPIFTDPITAEWVFDAYNSVLAEAGAYYPGRIPRDAADQRVIDLVASGAVPTALVDDPSDVGGWPTLAGGTAPIDNDHDGMPDWWETKLGLNPADPTDRNNTNLSQAGYTNLEVYINGLVTPLAGDFNNDGFVDAADYTVWRDNLGSGTALLNDNGLGTPIAQVHYDLWEANFGTIAGAGSSEAVAVPEPCTLVLLLTGILASFGRNRGTRSV